MIYDNMAQGKCETVDLVSLESRCFLKLIDRPFQSERNKIHWFPKRPDIKLKHKENHLLFVFFTSLLSGLNDAYFDLVFCVHINAVMLVISFSFVLVQ